MPNSKTVPSELFSFLDRILKKHRNLKILIKRNLRLRRSKIEKTFNFKVEQLPDVFFLGSIFLLIFKLFYRVYFSQNPFWLLNVCFLGLGGIQLKYDIVSIIREQFVTFSKLMLGYSYYGYLTELEVFETGKMREEMLIDMHNAYFFNKIMQNLYIFLIFVRLVILQDIYVFILSNFLLTWYLLTNQYLLISSGLSLILLLSRLLVYASDFNNKELFAGLHEVEKFDYDETIRPTWTNAGIVLLWITRSFSDRKSFLEARTSHYNRTPYKSYFHESYRDGEFFHRLYQKYPQRVPLDEIYTLDQGTQQEIISYRRFCCPDLTKISYRQCTTPYFYVLTINKKNTLIQGFILFFALYYFSTHIDCTQLMGGNPGVKALKKPKECEIVKIPQQSTNPRAGNHREIFILNDPSLEIITSSSIHWNNPSPFFGKLPDIFGSIYGYVSLTRRKELHPEHVKMIQNSSFEEIILPRDFSSFPLDHDRVTFILSTFPPKSPVVEYFRQHSFHSKLVLPREACIVNAIFNQKATKRQVLTAIDSVKRYHFNMAHFSVPQIGSKQKELHNIQYSLLDNMYSEIVNENKLLYSNVEDPILEQQIANFIQLNDSIINKSVIPVNEMVAVTAKIHGIPIDRAREHFSNLHHIPKHAGGVSHPPDV